jgi:multiple sugar transport system ATP-binding protein
MNCLAGTLECKGSHGVFVGEGKNQEALRINLGMIGDSYRHYIGKKVVMGVRPEWLAYAADSTGVDLIQAVVDVVEPTGSDNFVILNACGETLMARFAPGVGQPGQHLNLAIDLSKVLLFDAQTEQRIAR